MPLRAAQAGQFRPRLAAVRRFENVVDFGRIRGVRIFRIDEDRGIVERALAHLPLRVDVLPRRTAIVRTKNAAVLGLNGRVHHARIARRNRDADAAERPLREARIARDVDPVRAAVGRLIEAAARAAAR